MPLVMCEKVPVSSRYPDGLYCWRIQPFKLPDLDLEHEIPGPGPRLRDLRLLATIEGLAEDMTRDGGRDIIDLVTAKIDEANRALHEGASLTRQARVECQAIT